MKSKTGRAIMDNPVCYISHKQLRDAYNLPSDLMVISKEKYNDIVEGYKIDRDDKLEKYKNEIQSLHPIILDMYKAIEAKNILSKNIDINMQKIDRTNNIFNELIEEKKIDIEHLQEKEIKLQEVILNDKGLLNEIDKVKKVKQSLAKDIEELEIKNKDLKNKHLEKEQEYKEMKNEVSKTLTNKGDIEELYNKLELREQDILNKEYQLEEGFKFIDKKKDIMKQLVRELEMRYQKTFSQYERFQLD